MAENIVARGSHSEAHHLVQVLDLGTTKGTKLHQTINDVLSLLPPKPDALDQPPPTPEALSPEVRP